MKKYTIWVLILISVFLFCSCNKKEEVKVEETVEIKVEPFTLYEKDISDIENDKLYQKIIYTEIVPNADLINEKIAKSVNKDSYENAMDFKNGCLNDSRELLKDKIDPEFHYEYIDKLEIVRNDERYISFLKNCYMYTLGAHGSTVVCGLNFDARNGEKIKIFDIVKDKEKLKQYIIEYLEKNYKEELFPEYKDTINNYIDGELEFKFIINQNSTVTIILQQYDVAPYATGIIEIAIDKSLLSIEQNCNLAKNYATKMARINGNFDLSKFAVRESDDKTHIKDGIYKGSSYGMNDNIKVEVEISNKKISLKDFAQ